MDIVRNVPDPFGYVAMNKLFSVVLFQIDYDEPSYAASIQVIARLRPADTPGKNDVTLIPKNATAFCRAASALHKAHCWTEGPRQIWTELTFYANVTSATGDPRNNSGGYIGLARNCIALQAYFIPLSCLVAQGL